MNYLLFANPISGNQILNSLMKETPPKVVVTKFSDIDSWQRILFRFITRRLLVEDKLRFFYKKKFYDFESLNEKRLKRIVYENKIEIGFITTFSYKISNEIIDVFPKGLFNLHPSLLPNHGGANPLFWIIYNSDEYSGTTCHKVTDKLDGGEIVYQTKYNIINMDSKMLFKLYIKDCVKIIKLLIGHYHEILKNTTIQKTVEYDPKSILTLEELVDKCITNEDKIRINRALKFYGKTI